jgi:hypothetical protein
MRISLKFSTPFIVGGKRLTSNYIESMDYIQGNVVRAAFARVILDNCEAYNENEVETINGEEKKNWIHFREDKKCRNCKFQSWCKKFSDIKFSYFYPKDTELIPATAMICKNNEEHGFIDSLIEERKCTECPDKKGRVENTDGYMKNNKKYDVTKSLTSKTSIDRYTKTAYDGKFYSLVSVTETEKETKENIYEGCIEGVSQEELKVFDYLRIGTYTSVGYGKCNIEVKKENKKEYYTEINKIKEYSRKYKEFNKIEDNQNYIALMLTSDVKLQFNYQDNEYLSTEKLKGSWNDALQLDTLELQKVYADTFNYRGYDMSKVEDDKREEVVMMVKKGGVLVFSSDYSIEKINSILKEKRGIGLENENGFGDFRIYYGGIK